MIKQCNFKFRGSRDYIHSTDIYKFFQQNYPKISSLELIIKSKSKNQLIFKENTKYDMFDKKNIFCLGKVNKKKFIFLKTKKKIKYSYKFNENKYDELFQINKTFIKCKTQIKYDFIDKIICMINHLHKIKFPKKKYLLVKLSQLKEIKYIDSKIHNLKISTTANNHSPISINKVYLNNNSIIEIVYINK